MSATLEERNKIGHEPVNGLHILKPVCLAVFSHVHHLLECQGFIQASDPKASPLQIATCVHVAQYKFHFAPVLEDNGPSC